MKKSLCLALGAAVVLSACSTRKLDNTSGITPIIPAEAIQITSTRAISYEALATAAVIYLVTDPLAPNWRIEESQIGPDRFRLNLRRKSFVTGGDGEAMPVLRRRAAQIARDMGYSGYEVLEMTESLESVLPAPQRVAEAVIQITR